MRRHGVRAVVVAVTVLAGCLGGSQGPPDEEEPEPWSSPVQWFPTGYRGAEPTMGVSARGTLFVVAFDDVVRSRDGGETWSSVYRYGDEDPGSGNVSTLDPYLWLDPRTQRVWVNHLNLASGGGTCTFFAYSDDDGDSWTEIGSSCPANDIDHQKIVSAGNGPAVGLLTNLLEPGRVSLYLCYSTLGYVRDNQCAVSYDNGTSWMHHQVVITRSQHACGGLGGVPAVASNGTVAIVTSFACRSPVVAFTRNSGQSWQVVHGPQDEAAGTAMDPEAVFAPDGSLLVVWRRSDQVVHLARAADLNQPWSGPWRVAPPEVGSTVFQTVSVAPDGRVGMGFVGTADWTGRPGDAPEATRWYAWLALTSLEELATGSPEIRAFRATPDDNPLQVGPICVVNQPCPSGAGNLLEFIDGAFAPDGSYVVAFADGCTQACAGTPLGGPQTSRDRLTVVARLPPGS